MKILKFKGKMSLKNKILIAIAIITVISIVALISVYILNETARDWINIYILRKEVVEDDIASIELDVDKTEYVYAYDRYICILTDGKLAIYNSYASKEAELELQISNPIYAESNNYLGVAESNGQKVCLISERKSIMGK